MPPTQTRPRPRGGPSRTVTDRPSRARAVLARWAGLDRVLMAAVLALCVLSALLVWSATAPRDALTGGDPTAFLRRQLVNIAIGLVLMAVVAGTDLRRIRAWTPVVYAASIVGLLLVLVAGATINGSQSWLRVGGLSVQPSELAKPALIAMMALVLAESSRRHGASRARVGTREVALMLGLAAVPTALVLAQPDLGTVLVLGATVFGVLAVSGTPGRVLLTLVAAGGAVAAAAVTAGVLKAYQVNRFLAFVDPGRDPRGAGYNVEQARIAIGNGGLLGQGLFDGSQTRAGFVPEQQTDFVFTVAGEELGLVGATVVVVLLGIVVWRALAIARASDDVFGRVAAAGIACWFGFQAFQNVGMCLGIMPVTGVPLPFVSYGGSSLFAGLLAVGLLHAIHAQNRARGQL